MKGKITEFLKGNYYLLTALLMALSFPVCDLLICRGFVFFAWISLAPLFTYIRGKNYRDIFFVSFLTGLIGHLLVYNWIGYFGVGVGGTSGYVLVLSFLIPSLTVFFTTKILLAEMLSRRLERFRFLIYPAVWIFIDWIQSIGFLAFPWTYWGYSQFQFTPFIQLASFTGIMGITFVIVMFNYSLSEIVYAVRIDRLELSDILKMHAFRRFAGVILLIAAIIVYGIIVTSNAGLPGKSDLRPAIIQSCISPWENWRMNRFLYLKELSYYTERSLKDNPDFIIWSESATLEHISYNFENSMNDRFEKSVLDIARNSGKSLLTGEIGVYKDPASGRYFPQNNAVLIDNKGDVVKSYAKINLVPFGEWFPYEKWLPYIKELSLKMGGSSFVPGNRPFTFEIMGKKFGVLICYEGIFYRLCRRYRELGADFLVNITNDGWTDSYAGHIQHFSASVFRAVENGLWYVRAGNTGLTALIDPCGRIVKSIPILEKGYLVGDMDFSLNHETFYSKYGDVFLYIIMAFLFITVIVFFTGIFRGRRE